MRTEQKLKMLIYMTRSVDENLSLEKRANKARDVGADVFISLHFNGYNKIVRGTETIIRSSDNVNPTQDTALANRVNAAVYGAISAADAKASNRGVKSQGLGVLSDQYLGNTVAPYLTRAVLLETEFIDVLAVDQLLNTGANAKQVRQSIINALGDAILQDLRLNSPQ
jgi:N-acetylmuramoyl-L-alanine amidase